MQDICFVDVETTGLEHDHHEVIDIAAIRVAGDTLEEKKRYGSRIKPLFIERAHPKALEVNGYTDEEWEFAPAAPEVMHRVAPLLSGAMIAGHNVSFDYGFIMSTFARFSDLSPRIGYRKLDTMALAWPLLATREVTSLSLDSLCAHLGIQRDRAHSAMDDALASLEVARIMLERFQG